MPGRNSERRLTKINKHGLHADPGEEVDPIGLDTRQSKKSKAASCELVLMLIRDWHGRGAGQEWGGANGASYVTARGTGIPGAHPVDPALLVKEKT